MGGDNARDLGLSYNSFRTLIDAGHGISETLAFLRDSSRGAARLRIERLRLTVLRGGKLSEAMKLADYPELDVALISAGELTGSIPETAKMLSTHYSQRFEIERALKAAMAKPFLLLIVSCITAGIPGLFAGRTTLAEYLVTAFTPIIVLTALIVAGFQIANRSLFSSRLRAKVNQFASRFPFTKGLGERMANERFFTCFSMGLRAGCDFHEILNLLDSVSAGTQMSSAVRSLRSSGAKEGIAKALARTGHLSHDQNTTLAVGEETGTLDIQFALLAREMRDRVRSRIDLFAQWIPRILYALIVIFVAINMIENAVSSFSPDLLNKLPN